MIKWVTRVESNHHVKHVVRKRNISIHLIIISIFTLFTQSPHVHASHVLFYLHFFFPLIKWMNEVGGKSHHLSCRNQLLVK